MKNAVLFMPYHKTYPPSLLKDEKGKKLLDVVQRFLPSINTANPSTDLEDFIECYIQLQAVSKISNDEDIYIFNHNENTFKNIHNKEIDFNEYERVVFTGVYPKYRLLPDSNKLISSNKEVLLAEKYYNLETFKKYAGRNILIGSFDRDNDHYDDIMKSLNDGNYLIKTCATKYMPLIPFSITDRKLFVDKDMMDSLLLASVHMEGSKDGVIIQDDIKMYYEYRLIVVDNEIVSGAACIEEFTPFDRISDDVYDPQLRKIRGNNDIINNKDSAEVIEKYKNVCPQIVSEFKNEIPDMKNYIMDVFIDEFGDVGIVELNPFRNFGLYANDYNKVAKKLLKD